MPFFQCSPPWPRYALPPVLALPHTLRDRFSPRPLDLDDGRVIKGNVDTISKVARGLKVKAPATIVVGEVVSVLHGPEQGLLSDAAEGMFAGVDKDRVASAAERVAEKKNGLFSEEGGEKVPIRRPAL